MTEKLPLGAKIQLIAKVVEDFNFYKSTGFSHCPSTQSYTITASAEGADVEMAARIAAFKDINAGLIKIAFDTRRVDQEKDRNPRRNLQYWHRSELFVDEETQDKLDVFAKLDLVVKKIEADLGNQPEWFDSYVRALSTNLDRVVMKRAGDQQGDEVYKPHLSYLEQLIYNRYRLTMNDIKEASEIQLKDRLFEKDALLEKKEQYLISTGGFDNKIKPKTGDVDINERLLGLLEANLKQNNAPQSQQDALGALFGGSLRRVGDKTVERTITIKIVDSVID